MKKIILLLLCVFSLSLFGQNTINIFSGNEIIFSDATANVDSLKTNGGSLRIHLNDRFATPTFGFNAIDSIIFTKEEIVTANNVSIKFNESAVEILNPFEANGISVSAEGTTVEIKATADITNVHYIISGICNEASITIKSDVDFYVDLENTQLALKKGSIIANKSDAKMIVNIPFGSTSQLNGATKAAINSNGPVEIIGRGELSIASSAADYKAIKSDKDITLNGATLSFDISGDQSKAISSKSTIYVNGSIMNMNLQGNAVLEEDSLGYDPSYCTGLKADGDIYFNNGALTVLHSGDGGKGISVDGNLYVNGGNINITTTGGGEVYQDATNTKDSYTATAIKVDGKIYFNAGVVTCNSTGLAGKGISADGDIIIGQEGASNSLMQLNVSTSGERFYVSGNGENADYANPKAIKSDANVTVHSGTITINCTQSTEGGEGLESKNIMTINGGDIYIYSKMDDAVNAKKEIIINGGRVFASSDGNDGTDSNGTFTMNGGLYVSRGARTPEAGIDCDQNKFTINGGILIGIGGSTSNPNAGTQHALVYSATAETDVCLKDASGNIILCYKVPSLGNSTMMPAPPGGGWPGGGPGGGQGGSSSTLLLSHPSITKSSSYTIVSGGTISGGTEFNGYFTNAEYTGGTAKTVTTGSGYYTTVR